MRDSKMWTQVGTFTLKENTVFDQSGETASWFWKIEVPAGEYKVVEHRQQSGVFYVSDLDGVCVRSHVVNRLFSETSVKEDEDKGKQMRASFCLYDFQCKDDSRFLIFELAFKFMSDTFVNGVCDDMQALKDSLQMTSAKNFIDLLCNEVTWTFADGSNIEIFSGETFQINCALKGQ